MKTKLIFLRKSWQLFRYPSSLFDLKFDQCDGLLLKNLNEQNLYLTKELEQARTQIDK